MATRYYLYDVYLPDVISYILHMPCMAAACAAYTRPALLLEGLSRPRLEQPDFCFTERTGSNTCMRMIQGYGC